LLLACSGRRRIELARGRPALSAYRTIAGPHRANIGKIRLEAVVAFQHHAGRRRATPS
jgi:hypothetical protein